MTCVGLIPARGGSKRIARKNLALCAGKPLLAHTIEAALASHAIDRTLLSTDDAEILELGRKYGAEAPFLRPAELSAADAPMIGVMRHALDWLRGAGCDVEAIVLLQPTSPLRTARHIDEAVALFRRHPEAASVCSVVKPPHIFHPLKILKPTGDGLAPYIDGDARDPGQLELPPAYARNGPAVLVTRAQVIDAGEVYGMPSIPYEMPPDASIDIDEPYDLQIAEALMLRRNPAG